MNAISSILQQVKPTLLSHKIEILTAFIFALLALLLPYRLLEANFFYWIFVPLYLVIIYISRNNKFTYLISGFLPIAGSLLLYKLDHKASFYFENEKFWAVYFIALILFLSDKFSKDDERFIKNAMNKILNLALVLGIFILILIIIYAIILGIDYFFDTNLKAKDFWVNFHVANFIALTSFLLLLLEDKFYLRVSGTFFKQILNFILTPTLIIYTTILYFYIANIAFISGLPKGGVAIIVLIYLIVGFVLSALDLVLNSNLNSDIKFNKSLNFYKFFPYLVIAPAILLWIGILERVNTYGLTPSRIYLISASILASIIYILMIFKRLFSYRICAALSIVVISITFFMIDVNEISFNSQTSRSKAYPEELDLVNQYPEYRTLRLNKTQIDVSEYKSLIFDKTYYQRESKQKGFIEIFKEDKQIALINMNEHIKNVFNERKLDFYTIHPYEVINKLADDLLILYTENGKLILYEIGLMFDQKQGYTFVTATMGFFLEKE